MCAWNGYDIVISSQIKLFGTSDEYVELLEDADSLIKHR
jgi:hypothetical protein